MSSALVSEYFVFHVPAAILDARKVSEEQLAELGPVVIHRTGDLVDGRWDPYADKWAIRCIGFCLSRKKKWHMEPIPSSRTKGWLKDHRFGFAEAAKLLELEPVAAWGRE